MLSLVIGSRNEGELLQRTVEGALALDPPQGGLEVSVVDDGSVDGCAAFLEQPPWRALRDRGQLRLTRHGQARGVSAGRYRGAIGCRGEVLIFLDAHLTFPQVDLWRQVERHFAERRSDLLAVDCIDVRTQSSNAGHVYSSKRLCHQATTWVRQGVEPISGQIVPFVNGGFFAIRRAAYEALLGFPLFLQGWGHEDRYLSMLAGYCGYRCMLDQRLAVGHLYRDVMPVHADSSDRSDVADPWPADGLPPDLQPDYHHANSDSPEIPRLLMNSLRCGTVLYAPPVFAQLLEQLRCDYGALLDPALACLEQERPQLMRYGERLGLTPERQASAMEAFFERFGPYLPMLQEARLQAIRALPPAEGLVAIEQQPLVIESLSGDDRLHYCCARLYIEASFAYDLQDWERVVRCQLQLLSHDPDYLPGLRMLTIALRLLGRRRALRFWLQHAASVVEAHRPSQGPGPIRGWHPAASNPYLRYLLWTDVDRCFWDDLAALEFEEGNPLAAAPWLLKLLEQTPEDRQLRERLNQCIPPPPSDPLAA